MENKNFDFIIIGAGPAGIFAALEMAQKRPQSRVLIVDTGRAISHRACPARIDGQCKHCDPCAIVHGWAGAGAFSDGKLSLSDEVGGHVSDYIGHKRAMDYIHQADDIYLSFGASKTVHGLNNSRVDEIAYEASRYNIRLVPCPVRHLGTENAGPVLGAMHDYLVTKTNTTDVATFKSVNYGPLGYIHNGKIDYQRTPARKHTSDTPFDVSKLNELPKVGIVYNYANASDLPAKALVDAGYDGIVSAGVGNGNLYKSVFDTLATAAKNGTAVVRSSRVPTGATTQDAEVDDAKYGFVASGTLNPQKARVLLQLALTQTKDPQQIQQIFNQY